MKAAIIAVSIILGGMLLHLLALWLERRGWLYYKHTRPSRTALGNAFLQVQSLLEPDRKHLVELRKDEKRDVMESGDEEEKVNEPA
jgi:hypothetical protein